MPFPFRSSGLALLLAVAGPTPGRCAVLPVAGYTLRLWQTDDGLPEDTVTSAVQTPDGYLWFGTFGGLARFDGEQFQTYNPANTPALQDERISALFADARGTLWIGQENGAITRYRRGRFAAFVPASGPSRQRAMGIGSDAQGRLWAMRQDGTIDSLSGGPRVPSLIAPTYPGYMSWTRSRHGGIWVSENGTSAALVDGKLAPLSLGPALGSPDVLELAAARDRGVWILRDGRIRKWADGRWTEDRGVFPWHPDTVSACVELRDGTLAVGTIHYGLYLIFRDGRPPVHFDRRNGLPQDWIRFLYEDREGDLWAGDGSAGLVSIHSSPFSVLTSPDQWHGCSVLAVAPGADGALWIGTEGAGLYRYSHDQWTHYGAARGLGNPYITAAAGGPDGDVWAGNYWWGGPYRLVQGRFVRPKEIDDSFSQVLALLAGPAPGQVLVGNRDGAFEIKGGRVHWLVKAHDASLSDACALARTPDGAVWVGYARGGLVRISHGRVRRFGPPDGFPSDSVQCLLVADDGGLWIGTADRGLVRFKDGHFATLGVAQGIADTAICHVLDDGLGNLWLSTRHGIQRLAERELNRCADHLIPAVSGQIFNRGDGLPTDEFTSGLQGTGCRTPDGRLWFASSKGLVSVDPRRIATNRVAPPVAIESLRVDGNSLPIEPGAAAVRLPADHRHLEFHYTGLSFVAPNKVRFRYRLDGMDRGWVDAGTTRSAFYSRLPAGRYRFRVIACNNDGVWNRTGASLALVVAPFFWDTWWFLGLAALLAISSVAVLVRYLTRRRMQRKLDTLERQHAVERERARIAQDIHDDIGATLTRIAMFSQPDREELADTRQTAARLARIYSTSREATRALDEIVWAIDPKHDTLESLVAYMARSAQDLLEAAGIRCRLDLPPELPDQPLTAETRHNLFLAFEEALNNAVKHAGATEVRVSVQLRPGSFVLTVQDNGRGFDPGDGADAAPRVTGGHGLTNLHRRLLRIGGHCDISSQPGAGTTVSFVVALAAGAAAPARPATPSSPAVAGS